MEMEMYAGALYISLLLTFACIIFTVLHWMQGGLVARKVSICPSVKCMDC